MKNQFIHFVFVLHYNCLLHDPIMTLWQFDNEENAEKEDEFEMHPVEWLFYLIMDGSNN
jgi:hypothetical protein